MSRRREKRDNVSISCERNFAALCQDAKYPNHDPEDLDPA